MASFFLSVKAKNDLSEIWYYTLEKWSENQADNYFTMLQNCFQSISKNPEIGSSYTRIARDLYFVQAGRHLVFYRIVARGQIEIVRILHEQMNLKNRIIE